MPTLTLELPEQLAEQLSGIDQQVILKMLEAGLRLHKTGEEGQPVEHPHITRVPGVLGGRPILRGSRLPIWQVAKAIVHLGEPIEDYIADHPHLTIAKIYDGLSYYYDHRAEVDREIEENKAGTSAAESGMVADERGIWRFPKKESGNS
jgi:uncharacterized protein (DUF433 family)